jgi:hypothetical protein
LNTYCGISPIILLKLFWTGCQDGVIWELKLIVLSLFLL